MRSVHRALIITILVSFSILFAPSSGAVSVPGCDGAAAPVPESAGEGVSGLLGRPVDEEIAQQPATPEEIADGKRANGSTAFPDHHLFAEYGAAGLSWHAITESCVDKAAYAPVSAAANMTWSIAKSLNILTIRVYQLAYDGAVPTSVWYFTQDSIVSMRDSFWRPLIPVVVVCGAVWMIWTGLIQRRATLSVQGAGWMVAAVVGGLVVLGAPGDVMLTASRVTMIGGDIGAQIVYPVDASDGKADIRCPRGAVPIAQAQPNSSALDSQVQENSERLWAGMICEPWLSGEFGSGKSADAASKIGGLQLLNSQAVTRSEQKAIDSGRIDATELYDAKSEGYENLAAYIEDADPGMYATFSGDRPMDRLGIAFVALLFAISAGGLVFLLSLALVLMQVGFILLMLMSPVFFLAGIHPGKGRILLTRWAETAVGMLLKQVFLMFLTTLLLKVYSGVLATAIGWGAQMVTLSIFTLAIVVFRKPFTNLVGHAMAATSPARIVEQVSGGRVGVSGDSGAGRDVVRQRGTVSGRRHGERQRRRTRGGKPVERKGSRDQTRDGAGPSSGPAAEGASGQTGPSAGEGSPAGSSEQRPAMRERGPRRDPQAAPARDRAAGGRARSDAQQARDGHNPRARGATAGDVGETNSRSIRRKGSEGNS